MFDHFEENIGRSGRNNQGTWDQCGHQVTGFICVKPKTHSSLHPLPKLSMILIDAVVSYYISITGNGMSSTNTLLYLPLEVTLKYTSI